LERVCIDTDVSIELIRGNVALRAPIEKRLEGTPFLAAISVFELLRATKNLQPVENFILEADILYFDEVAARKASSIEKELRKKGKLTAMRDLFIAATAMSNNCELATLNRKDFEKIDGLKLLDF